MLHESNARMDRMFEAADRRAGARELERMAARDAATKARGAAVERQIARRILARTILGIGARVVSGAVGALIPSELATGDLTSEQIQRAEQRANADRARELERVEVTRRRLEVPRGTGLQALEVTAKRLPNTRQTPQVGPPRPAPSSSGPSRFRQSIFGRLPWQQILLSSLIGSLGSSRSSSSSAPITAAELVSSGEQPIPNLTRVGSAGVPFIPRSSITGNCECPPKRKRTKRKCLERAEVSWRTGRYKGKKAGTKCVRFAEEK